MLNFVSPGERSASAGHQDKLLNPRRILVNPGELVSLQSISIAFRLVAMTTLWSRDREIQEIARKVPDPLSMKAGSGNETTKY